MSSSKSGIRVNLSQSELQEQKLHKELEVLRGEYRDFVYAVSHDLVGPFRQIEGFANIILSKYGDQFDDQTRHHFELIMAGSENGKAVLEALLDYSRLTTPDSSHSTVYCENIIKDVLGELTPLIETTGAVIQWKPDLDTISCTVLGDKPQLHQLFYQLIHNSMHYRSKDETPRVSIEVKELEHEWRFSITDNGIGMREKMAGKVFSPLKRGVADKKYSGIGMGLTIARSVVQRHGGKIWLTSESGIGSSFSFTLSKENQHD